MSAGFKLGPEEEMGSRHGEGLTFLATVVRENFYWGDTQSLPIKGRKEEERGSMQVFEGEHSTGGIIKAEASW